MSDIMSWGGWSLNDGVGTGLAAVGSGLAGLLYGGKVLKQNQQAIDNAQQINMQNYELMKEQQSYERNLQQTMFEREDNSVQRRAKDLEAAGLSKTLAAGSGAQAGPVIKSTAPNMSTSAEDKRFANNQFKIALMTQSADIARTVAQTKLLESQAKNQESVTKLNEERNVGQVLSNAFDRSTLSDREKLVELRTLIAGLQRQRDETLYSRYWTHDLSDGKGGYVGKSVYQKSRYEQQLDLQIENARKKLGLSENELEILKQAGIAKGMGNYAQLFSMIKKMDDTKDYKMLIQMLLTGLSTGGMR